jgi:selenocysteine lyase/cysteine desulfurase
MREHFHVPENYFLSHSVGCLPKASPAELTDGLFGPWASGETWSSWLEDMDIFRAGLARLLGVKPSTICPQTNISSGLTKILHSLPKRDGRDVILLSQQDFPTIGFVAKQAERLGYRIVFIEGDPTQVQRWDDAIDDTVAFVLATHALSNTSHLLPIAEICALARNSGAISVVDIAQSFGGVPFELASWKPDFAVGTGVKFMCFGPGACFLYASEHMIPTCEPLDVGWFSHENPFEMDIRNFRYAYDAMRFFGGTPSPAPYVLANAAMSVWKDIWLGAAHQKIQNHLDILHAAVPDKAIISPSDRNARGATFVVSKAYGDEIHPELIDANIKFDKRKQGYRFSVHGYTSDAELENLIKVFSRLN